MSKRSILTRLAILVPALVLIAAMISTTMSCGGGIFPEVTATTSPTPTATVSPGSGGFAYVTDFNTGKVVECKRNTTTGALSIGTAVSAGTAGGPTGMAVTLNNAFLYVANSVNNNIRTYKIGSNGVPSPVATTAVGTAPEQMAINQNDDLLFVTNAGSNLVSGSITSFNLNASTGALTVPQTIGGVTGPFGIIVDNTDSYLIVADNSAGMVRSYSFNSSGQIKGPLSSVNNLSSKPGKPINVVEDSSGFIYVTDNTASAVSVFSFNTTNGALAFVVEVGSSSTAAAPFGVGLATISSVQYLLTADQGTNFIDAFPVLTAGSPSPPTPFAGGNVIGPKGLEIDPQGFNLYTADNGDGTVAQFSINPAVCPSGTIVCYVGKAQTESGNTASGPFNVVLTH